MDFLPQEPEVPICRTLTPAELFVTFFRIGSLAFGGGGSTLAMMHREFCADRRVVSEEEFQILFGVSRIVPGMNLLSLTVLLGHHSRGATGALVSLLGLTVPSFALIIAGCAVFRSGRTNPYLAGTLRGLAPAVAALLLHTVWQLSAKPVSQQRSPARYVWVGILAAAGVAAAFPWIHPVWTLVGAGLLGAFLAPRLGVES